MRQLLSVVSWIALVMAAIPLPAEALTHSYSEDFTSTQYRDIATTTADWDTLAGSLGLHPLELSIRGTDPTSAKDVVVAGNYAYTASTSGLNVFDITDPESPTHVGSYDLVDGADRIGVSGDLVYTTDMSGDETRCFDISDPETPGLRATVSGGGLEPLGLDISGDYMFVATNGVPGLFVYALGGTVPLGPGCFIETESSVTDVVVSGDYAYLASSLGVVIVDISDPLLPVIVGTASVGFVTTAVAVTGNTLIVGGCSVVGLCDITDPEAPYVLATLSMPGNIIDIKTAGDHAYLSVLSAGLHAIDISDRHNPIEEGSVAIPPGPAGFDIAGEYAFVGAQDFTAVRIGHMTIPTDTAITNTTTPMYGVAVDGDFAYFCGDGSFSVADIIDPGSPAILNELAIAGVVYDVEVAGNYAYLYADAPGGFHVVDVTEPMSPSLAFSAPLTGAHPSQGLDVQGNYAYVLDSVSGLRVFDVSDPTACIEYGPIAFAFDVRSIEVVGNYAFLGCNGSGGLLVLDVSTPTSPATAALTGGTATGAGDLEVCGEYLYMANDYAGIKIYHIADPPSASFVGDYGSGPANNLSVVGDYLLTTIDATVMLHDISDPEAPSPVVVDPMPWWASHDMVVDGDHAYLALGFDGLAVLEIMQRKWVPDLNVGASKDIDPNDLTATWLRMTSSQEAWVGWEISATGGMDWAYWTPNGTWVELGVPGSELLWRSTHTYWCCGANPACTSLQIDWLYDVPVIDEIIDVENDQGRQVRVSWSRSAKDRFDGSTSLITEYAVYRRIDDIFRSGLSGARGGSTYLADRATSPDGQSPLYPPGDWEFLTTVPARLEDEYAVTVPTLADSTISGGMHHSVFFISALTAEPWVFYDSPPDSGYSVDNLAPYAPSGFALDYNATQNHLAWDEAEDADFQYFRVYRSEDSDFTHGPESLVHTTINNAWVDEVTAGWGYYYKITAVDFSGNESDPSLPESVTGLSDHEVPGDFALLGNTPNPVNGSTTIHYAMPAGEHMVRVDLFTAGGRLIRHLVDGYQPAGVRHIVWDSKDENGMDVAAGIYYCRLAAEGAERQLKIVVLR